MKFIRELILYLCSPVEVLEHHIFKLLSKSAESMGLKSYIVGGFVRDLILKRDNKDLDVVVIGSGIEYAQSFYELLPQKEAHIAYFKNFGTAQIKYKDWIIEIIGARKESYRRDSRKPIVENGTLEDDQNRRDFTINSLYISLNEDNYGELYDPFNGVQHLQDGIIKTPTDPDTTFSDDPLRMLRAIRFAARLGFEIEQETWNSICRNAYRLEIVSQERITDEFNAMIMGKKPSVAFDLLLKSGLLEQFFPEFVKLLGIETIDGKSHKDNFYHTTQVLDQICELTDNLWLRWAAILHDIAKPQTKRFDPEVGWTFHGHEDRGSRMVKGIFRRLKLPLDDKLRYVEKLVAMHLRPIVLSKEIVTDSAVRRLIVEAGEDVGDLLILCRADITSKNKIKVAKHIENLKKVEEKIQEVLEKDELRNWQPVLTGNHILERYNVVNPRHIGDIKNHVREAILDGLISNDLEEALRISDEFVATLNVNRR
jgi:poly(A) polymerase